MKKTTHLIYLAIIAALAFLAFKSEVKDGEVLGINVEPEFETNGVGTKALTRSDSDIFYAYIRPNDPEVHIVNEYQPDLDYREIGDITYPFIKGTDKMLIALNTSPPAKQWIWQVYDRSVLKGYGIESIPRIDILPQEYRIAIYEHNKAHPQGKGRVGEAMVRALFRDDQYTRKYSNRPPAVDFDRF